MNKAKCIMMITSLKQPVPAVGGGATQELITTLLDENETKQRFRFVIISVADKRAEAYHYDYSKVYYCDRGVIEYGFLPFSYLYNIIMKAINKVQKLTRKIIRFIPEKAERIPFDPFFIQCARIAKKEKVDYVICEGTLFPAQYKRFHKIVGRDNLFYHMHVHKKEDLAAREIVPNGIYDSDFVNREWAATYIPGSRNITIHCCVDTEGFGEKLPPRQRQAMRKKYGVGDDEFLAIYFGRIVPIKGIEELLKAFQLLKGQPVKLLLIGSVAFDSKVTTEFSERMASVADRMESVIRLGYVPNEQLPVFCSMADFQIMPSTCNEAGGMAAIEGMAAGLPIIMTKTGGTVEYVTDECAIKLPINDELPENLASAVLRLIGDREWMKRMGEKGRERAKLFTKEKYYSDFVKVFCDK